MEENMNQKIAAINLLVDDYDKAKDFYVNCLGFELKQDIKISEQKRWVEVCPKGASETSIILSKATNEMQKTQIGNQCGGKVLMIIFTDNFERDYKNYSSSGVKFNEEPRYETYGTVAVFEDLYGNKFDLLQPG